MIEKPELSPRQVAFETWANKSGIDTLRIFNDWTNRWEYTLPHVQSTWLGFDAGGVWGTQNLEKSHSVEWNCNVDINFTSSNHFKRRVQVTHVDMQPGTVNVKFSSNLDSAKNPKEWQSNFEMSMSREELRRLANALLLSLGN